MDFVVSLVLIITSLFSFIPLICCLDSIVTPDCTVYSEGSRVWLGPKPNQGSCYSNLGGRYNFTQALALCRERSGYIVVPSNLDESRFVASKVVKQGETVFLGLKQTDGTWQDISTNEQQTYFEWALGEPSNQPNKDCVGFNPLNGTSKGWFDISCTTQNSVICEHHIGMCPPGYELRGFECHACDQGSRQVEVMSGELRVRARCEACGEGMSSSTPGTTSCSCDRGYQLQGGVCQPCGINSYKPNVGNETRCESCARNNGTGQTQCEETTTVVTTPDGPDDSTIIIVLAVLGGFILTMMVTVIIIIVNVRHRQEAVGEKRGAGGEGKRVGEEKKGEEKGYITIGVSQHSKQKSKTKYGGELERTITVSLESLGSETESCSSESVLSASPLPTDHSTSNITAGKQVPSR